MPCRTRRRDIAIMRYRVTALYDFPPVECGIVVEADTPEHAMVQAVLEGLLPVAFERDAHGWLQPEMWHAELGGARRWPTMRGERIEWGEGEARQQLPYYITEEEDGRDRDVLCVFFFCGFVFVFF